MWVSTLGWIGNLFLIANIWELGNKKRIAHAYAMVGEGAWIVKSAYYGQYDLAFMCCVFFILAWRCWIKWGVH